MLRQIILDTETTGLSPQEGHRIIEIGCLEMINRQLTGESFHHYINPERAIDPNAQAVHGITLESLIDKPVFAEIAEALLNFIQGSELIIHNAPFDLGFLNSELQRLKKGHAPLTDNCSVIDTLQLARRKHPGQQNNLDALCRRYKVDNSNRELHGALLDAELLAHVYLLMTGGQVELFATVQSEDGGIVNAHEIQRVKKDSVALPVITATEQELAAHADFLQFLKVTETW